MQYVLNVESHDAIVRASYAKRGYDEAECGHATHMCRLAAWHGIKTHNGIKALDLDDHFGSRAKTRPGCVPGAKIEKKHRRFDACQVWNAHQKLGQAVAFEAMRTAMELADRHGVGMVCVDKPFHYLWGGGYVMEAARQGYIAYTNCTSTTAEVVPFMGKHPTLGTNPHSWGYPTTDIVGFPIVVDWATSTIAMGRVAQLAREGLPVPDGVAVDAAGNLTTDPKQVKALLPFGAHKGYGLCLIIELTAAMIGGSLPTLRGAPTPDTPRDEKHDASFLFQAIHPEAISGGAFACGRDQTQNLKAVIQDVLGHDNEQAMLPGQVEHEAALRSERAGGLIFTEAEINEWRRMAAEAGVEFDKGQLGRLD